MLQGHNVCHNVHSPRPPPAQSAVTLAIRWVTLGIVSAVTLKAAVHTKGAIFTRCNRGRASQTKTEKVNYEDNTSIFVSNNCIMEDVFKRLKII